MGGGPRRGRGVGRRDDEGVLGPFGTYDHHLDLTRIFSTRLLQWLASVASGLIMAADLLMTVFLNDRTFTAHTQETFESTFPAKVQAFRVLEEVLDINNLEFLVAFSSISGMFGNPGQTNYSA